MFGSPETQPGGRALKFYCSQRLDMRRIETLKEGTEAVGNRVRVKVVKNKVASPFRQAEFDITYGEGISHEGGLIDLGLEHDLIQKSGSFFSYGELRLGQGRNNTKQYLAENPDLASEIEVKLFAELGLERTPTPPRAVPQPDVEEAEPEMAPEEAEEPLAENEPEPERQAA
jgi:recombination protein RecA